MIIYLWIPLISVVYCGSFTPWRILLLLWFWYIFSQHDCFISCQCGYYGNKTSFTGKIISHIPESYGRRLDMNLIKYWNGKRMYPIKNTNCNDMAVRCFFYVYKVNHYIYFWQWCEEFIGWNILNRGSFVFLFSN